MSDSKSSDSKTEGKASEQETKRADKSHLGQPGLEYPENPKPNDAGVIYSDDSDSFPWHDGLGANARDDSKSKKK